MFHRTKRAILLKASELHHQQCDVMAGVVAIALYFGSYALTVSTQNTKQHFS